MKHTTFRSATAAALALLLAWPVAAAAAPSVPAPTLGLPTAATTPSADDEAAGRRHYKKGDDLFKAGRFLEAAREFEAGFAVAPRPLFLLNIGHSYRKGQELRKARGAYEEYLKMDPGSSFRSDVEDLIKTIDDALGASALPSAPPPPISPPPPGPLGGPAVGATPPLASTSLPPAAPPAAQSSTAIDLAPPVLRNVDEPPQSESSSIFRNPWFWGAVGVVLVAGVAGTAYGLNRAPACTATRCLRETD